MIEKIETIRRIQEAGIIAVCRNIQEDKISELADALISSGIRALEITLDNKDAYSTIEFLSNKYKDEIIVGAGTVIDGYSAGLAINKGARFILSPSFNPEVVKTTLRYGKVAIPGVMTPTEMIQAMESGADMVKIFPSSVLGVKFIKDVKGPFPQIPVIPTGGIDVNNVGAYIEAGVEAVGAGGSLIDKEAIYHSDFQAIRETATKFVEEIKKARIKIGQ